MRNPAVSDIFGGGGEADLFSVKGDRSVRLRRRRQDPAGLQAGVFPSGQLLPDVERAAKANESVSHDEQERAVNILAKLHAHRSDATPTPATHARKPIRRRVAPDLDDLELAISALQHAEDDVLVAAALSAAEMRFLGGVLAKRSALPLLRSRLRLSGSPSSISRNPITGSGCEEAQQRGRRAAVRR